MVIVAGIYLRFYIEVGVGFGVGTFLLTPIPPKFLQTLAPQLRLCLHSPGCYAVLPGK
jgi:hypothetical protein